MAEIGAWVGQGRLLLETDDLVFRGAQRLSVPLRELTDVEARDGWLGVRHTGGSARFELGDAAAKWADAIRNPRSLLDKLGVKPGARVGVVGVDDDGFLDDLRARAPAAVVATSVGALEGDGFELIVYGADEPGALDALAALRSRIASAGAIWVVTPKGRPEVGRTAVIEAARGSGLVDVKTARFSGALTSLKLVIPRAARR